MKKVLPEVEASQELGGILLTHRSSRENTESGGGQ